MRDPDYEGWLYPYTYKGPHRPPRRVRIWLADPEPAAPEEWHGHLYVEGLEGYDPPRPVPGGTQLQATVVTFDHLHTICREQDGYVA